jgi:hypothetical protein
MKFELENDTQEGHCSMSIACNRLPSFLPSGPPSIRISEFSLFFILFQKLSDHTKILKHTNVFYHLLLNLTIYSNTWLHLLKHCLLIIWRIFTTNFIFKDVVKKWNWWFFIIDEEDRQLTRIHCCPKATKICLLDFLMQSNHQRIHWRFQLGPVTRLRAKKFKEAFNGLLQDTWAKVDFKRICNNKEQVLINLIHV